MNTASVWANSEEGKAAREDIFELRGHTRQILAKWWLFILAGIVAGAIGYVTAESYIPRYKATAKVLVQAGGGSAPNDFESGRRTSPYYADLARTRTMFEAIAADLGTGTNAEDLEGVITVRVGRTFLEIAAEVDDPRVAAVMANTASETIIRELSRQQVDRLVELQSALDGLIGVDQAIVAPMQARDLQLLSIVESAYVPVAPENSPSDPALRAALFAVASTLALIIVLALKGMLRPTIFSESSAAGITGFTRLGSVPYERLKRGHSPDPFGVRASSDPILEATNLIQTQIEFGPGGAEPPKSIVITSSTVGEGKSTFASQLAQSYAMAGRKTVIVDADLRDPIQHRLFNVENHDDRGLSTALSGQVSAIESLIPTGITGLSLLPAGPGIDIPAYALQGRNFASIKAALNSYADVVIYDCPPVLQISDPLLVASGADLVIQVIEAGRTDRESVERTAELLVTAGATTYGVVVTKTRSGPLGYQRKKYGYPRNRDRASDHAPGNKATRTARALATRLAIW